MSLDNEDWARLDRKFQEQREHVDRKVDELQGRITKSNEKTAEQFAEVRQDVATLEASCPGVKEHERTYHINGASRTWRTVGAIVGSIAGVVALLAILIKAVMSGAA